METVSLELPLIGAKVLDSLEGFEGVEVYHGASYCDAVRNATFGKELVVAPGSIEVCRWSPVVLGLKQPGSDFERSLEPRLDSGVRAIYVAPLSRYSEAVEPDVVIVRGRPAQLHQIAAALGQGAMQARFRGQIGRSALGVGEHFLSARVMLNRALNRLLTAFRTSSRFDHVVNVLFRRESVSAAFEKVGKNAVADMSICRNSTVLPHVEDAGNITYFCTGGVTWGGNSPAHMAAGFPFRLIEPLLRYLDYPAK